MSKITAAGVFAIIVHFLLSLYLTMTLGTDLPALIVTNVHFILGTLLLMALLKAHLRYNVPLILSAPSIFLLIHCNYFLLSSLKYLTIPFYISFRTDLTTRALGSLIAIISLYIAYFFLSKWLPKQTEKVGPQLQTILDRKELLLLLPAMIMALPHFWGIYQTIQRGYSIEAADKSYGSVIINEFGKVGFIMLLMSLALITFKYSRRKEWNVIGTIMMLLFFFITLILSLNVGARHMVYFVVVAILVGYSIRMPARAFSCFILLFIMIEVAAIVALGPVTSMFSRVGGYQREGGNWSTEQNIQGLTYRSDLSDFAISIAMDNKGSWGAGPSALKDAFVIATPRALNPGKFQQMQYTYEKFLMRAGWNPITDYSDTLISTGYVILGWPGMFLLLPAYLLIIIFIQNLLYSWRSFDPLISLSVVALCALMFFIEIDIYNIFTYFRRIITILAVYYGITRIMGLLINK